MGFGLNAADNPTLADFSLAKSAHIELIPKVHVSMVDHYRTEFARWIVTSGLREAIEAFALFLDGIHDACLVMSCGKGNMPTDNAAKEQHRFQYKGLREKLELLQERFGISCSDVDVLLGVNRCRNCLTHRGGRIGEEDCSDSGRLEIQWPGVELVAKAPDEETVHLFPLEQPTQFLSGATLTARLSRRSVTYYPGDIVNLTPTNVAEICWFITRVTNEITRSAEEYAQSLGIKVRGT